MRYSDIRVLEALFTLVLKGIENVVDFNIKFPEYPLESSIVDKDMKKWTLIALNWAFVGDIKLALRKSYFD